MTSRHLKWKYDDGGRLQAGFTGVVSNSIVRSIAIALHKPYKEVFEELKSMNNVWSTIYRNQQARRVLHRGNNPEKGVPFPLYVQYLKQYGWKYVDAGPMSLTTLESWVSLYGLRSHTLIVRLGNELTVWDKSTILDVKNPAQLESKLVKGYFKNTL